jgi:hypothetical protein
MAIVKVKKTKVNSPKLPKLPEKKVSKKETPLAKIIREREEREAQAIEDAKLKELQQAVEETRLEKWVIPYLDRLQNEIVGKNLLEFWTFPDEPGFKKLKGIPFKDMQKFINKDRNKYKNRKVALISLLFYHHDKPTNIMRQHGNYFAVSMTIFPIDKHGVLNGDDNAWGADLAWKLEDFKTTKFTFKLIETILNPVGKRKKIFTSLLGFSITFVINELKKIRVNFDNILKPLLGA